MGLVDDEGVVLVEKPVLLDLRQQHAVGHQLDRGLGPHPVVEAHLVAHQGTELVPSSWETRLARLRAAMRRGWV